MPSTVKRLTYSMQFQIDDMNTKVGGGAAGVNSPNQSVGPHGMGSRNNNVMRLVNFCDEAGLVIGGTLFPHKTLHRGT